jgi:hypothetical protein
LIQTPLTGDLAAIPSVRYVVIKTPNGVEVMHFFEPIAQFWRVELFQIIVRWVEFMRKPIIHLLAIRDGIYENKNWECISFRLPK